MGLSSSVSAGMDPDNKKIIRSSSGTGLIKPQITSPRGAIYIPAGAYNTWQQWNNYDQQETERDFSYAARLNLDSLRIWLSYEYWLEAPERLESCLDQMLTAADKQGLKILLALFDSCGVDNTKAARENRNFKTAVAVKSPGLAISRDESRWNEPAGFVERIMGLHADDDRILAIEVMNEPGVDDNRLAMTRYLFKRAKEKQKTIPLTVGSLHDIQNWGSFIDLGIDIIQYHYNFPRNTAAIANVLKEIQGVSKIMERPFWLTEWQRTRPGGDGWDQKKLQEDELGPDLASLAGVVRQSQLGNYFWSLMLKPAYLRPQRNIGSFNGLFFEDGAVYSLADAKAISGNAAFQAEERKALPDWWR